MYNQFLPWWWQVSRLLKRQRGIGLVKEPDSCQKGSLYLDATVPLLCLISKIFRESAIGWQRALELIKHWWCFAIAPSDKRRKESRFHAYGAYSRLRFGVLHRYNWRPYSDPNHWYVGFQTAITEVASDCNSCHYSCSR